MASSNSSAVDIKYPEPIAIVGIGCRFPGNSDSPGELWQMLLDERHGRCKPPLSRYNIDGFGANKNPPGKMKPMEGYFINEGIWSFDPSFFGIVDAEASAMDPQQRKLLECVYEAFESGGITLAGVAGTNTGVYVGNFTYDYYLQAQRDYDNPKAYSTLGGSNTIISNRVSYLFDLCGPSFTLDSACSSSLYALHLASRALVSGEIDGAVVGGVNLMLAPEIQMSTDQIGALSGTSTSHTFDIAADGYGRAEGIGALYLKRISDAVRDKDPIRGVVRGTALNANGKTPGGITRPRSTQHEAVIRAAYEYAGINSKDTAYFETHGTGTPVGDPIEMRGLAAVFLEDESRDCLLVGSVKTNVGHSEAASAMSQIIKVVLALENKVIPPTIGIKEFNPNIDFHNGRLKVVQQLTPWPKGYTADRASINSFGYGGANAHAILEATSTAAPNLKSFARIGNSETTSLSSDDSQSRTEFVGTNGNRTEALERSDFLLPFSAHDTSTLKNNIEHIREVAENYDISDLAYTLGCRRSSFFNCAYAIVRADELEDDLMEHEITFAKRGNGSSNAFIFTGQGAQSPQMGRELMLNFPSFIDSIRKLDLALQNLGDDAPSWLLEDVLLEPSTTSKINDVEFSQPVCTAVQVAIVELLAKWNIHPVACIGHSSGEIASAFASGLLSAEEAIISAYYRGLAVKDLKMSGAMLAVGASPEDIEPYLVKGVGIACYNSPNSITLSGDKDAADTIQAKLQADNIFVRGLQTSGRAYHSHHMKIVGSDYETRLDEALMNLSKSTNKDESKTTKSAFFSSVYGKRAPSSFKPRASYWRSNLESPVRFSEAVAEAVQTSELDINHFIEIGPHSALAGPLRQIRDGLGLSQRELDYTPTLVRGQDAVLRLLDLAGRLSVKGYPVDFGRVNARERRINGTIVAEHGLPIVDLPRYSWNYEGKNAYHRNENRPDIEYRTRKFLHHDLLGSRVPGSSTKQCQWRCLLNSKHIPWLEEHRLGSQAVLPATGYIAIATEAARQFLQGQDSSDSPLRYFFPRMDILAALNIPDAGSEVEVLTTMRYETISASIVSKAVATFTISSYQSGVWTENCVGTIRKDIVSEMMPLFDDTDLQEPKNARTWYNGFKSISLNYGPPFQGLDKIRADPAVQEAVAYTALLPSDTSPDDSSYLVHPATMDTCIHVSLIAAHNASLEKLKRSFIPTTITNVSLWSWNGESFPKLTPGQGKVLAAGYFPGVRSLHGSCQLSSPSGQPLFEIGQMACTQYSELLSDLDAFEHHPYLRVLWKPDIDKLDGKVPAKSLLDLVTHKRPTMDILEISDQLSEHSAFIHRTLESGSALRRFKSYTVLSGNDNVIEGLKADQGDLQRVSYQKSDILTDEITDTKSDLLINLSAPNGAVSDAINRWQTLLNPITPQILLPRAVWAIHTRELEQGGLKLLHDDGEFMLLTASHDISEVAYKEVVLVTRSKPTSFESRLVNAISLGDRTIRTISLADKEIKIDPDTTYISTIESTTSVFEGSLTKQELEALQLIFASARSILWITHGNLLAGDDPSAAMAMGFGRCLQTEHPTLTFKTLDLDHRDPKLAASQIMTVLRSNTAGSPSDDKEFIVQDSVFYISRLSQDAALDQQYIQSVDREPISTAIDPSIPVRLRIERVGMLDTLFYEHDPLGSDLQPNEVEVQVKAFGLNMKDFAVLQGTFNADIMGLEGSGIVANIGKAVTNFRVGDKVAFLSLGPFSNIQRLDYRQLLKIGAGDSFEVMAGLFLPALTAVYGLIHLAKLQKGERVLIHSATGGVGLAAIQVAQMIGAEIFATVGSPEKRAFLKANYGLDDGHILSSKGTGFAKEIMDLTAGHGVDVTLNSLVREQLRATWNCIAYLGRHIELGQTDILDEGVLDMAPFKRSASFMAVDLAWIVPHHDLAGKLMRDVMQLYREGIFKPQSTLSVFPASDVISAYKRFGEMDRIGRVVVSFDNTANLTIAPKRLSTKYRSDGTYLLVGCLGGLGRSLARHMVDNGARDFIFLGRSGEERPEAASMIRRFRAIGIAVQVVKGDVTSKEDVQRAVKCARKPLIGVVQGVMALDDRLFSKHTVSSWEYAVLPKVTGTWNLHNAITDPLDFFVMLGSTSALIGVPTQSNYCAGNSFLEYFARYRRSRGLPATTISLTAVSDAGFVSQNDTIGDGLSKLGISSINEAEFIRLMDTAVKPCFTKGWAFDTFADNFLVTGIEPSRMPADQDIDIVPFWRHARTGPILNAVLEKISGTDSGHGSRKSGKLDFAGVLEMILEKFSKTFNMKVDDMDISAPVVSFGMDSMIGTSLRTWCYKQFGADIASSEFMSSALTATKLAESVMALKS